MSTLTPEGGGYTIRHGDHWETWRTTRQAAERAVVVHKQKCKEESG